MHRTRLSPLVTLIMLALCASVASAAERKVFDPTDFAAAQGKGQRILVDISATWCPTCKAQAPIIDRLAADKANDDLVIYDVDFDSMQDVVRGFGARMQSTLIAYAGKRETARSVGDTDPASIAALVSSNRAE